ncbi:hypothetical protein LCM17_18535 [Cereibacter sphaeroides]|nr:hypothetical protein [Cereibacter sphaeroides]
MKKDKTPEVDAEVDGATAPEDDGPELLPEVDSDIDVATLSGDLRDAMLTRFRLLKRPFSELSEQEQTEVANGLDLAARDLVRKAVREITRTEFEHVVITLGEVKIKGEKGIEAKITCPNLEHNRSILGEHVGDMVTLLMIDSERFLEERGPAQIDRDQGELEISGDYPEGPQDAGTDEAPEESAAPDAAEAA